ncbi:MAG: hypothetical protein KDA69_19850, partial [Planctomycetaceae bacterium]|nr:hypothetical protein [Planctomycetaceae bacterium]
SFARSLGNIHIPMHPSMRCSCLKQTQNPTLDRRPPSQRDKAITEDDANNRYRDASVFLASFQRMETMPSQDPQELKPEEEFRSN